MTHHNHLLAVFSRLLLVRALLASLLIASAQGTKPLELRTKDFQENIQPFLQDYCFDCHGEGSSKGNLSLDDQESGAHHLDNKELWLKIWKNLRTDLMPPSDKDQPKAAQRQKVVVWIEQNVFLLDPAKPDPGRVTMRRLNRVEYAHTIKDLLDVDYDVSEHFPPDDTGYGFDTIGDVLSISTLHLEKYLAAAEVITARALPQETGRAEAITFQPAEFRQKGNNSRTARFMRAGQKHRVGRTWSTGTAGKHQLTVTYQVMSRPSAKGVTATWKILVDDKEKAKQEIAINNGAARTVTVEAELAAGEHVLEFEMLPDPKSNNANVSLAVKVIKVEAKPPTGELPWESYPTSYRLVFSEGLPPADASKREPFARDVLERFLTRAWRKPPDAESVDQLLALAKSKWKDESRGSFEAGIRHALTAVLSSPPFLLRGELPSKSTERSVPIDEYALATRLSYFLWCSPPDDQLLKAAKEGTLRQSLAATIDRMLADPKADRFVRHFVGQWLGTKNLPGMFFDTPRVIGTENENLARNIFNLFTRQDMQRETELFVVHLLRENRPAVELITADYSFINDRLAKFYGVPNVSGKEFRKVTLNTPQRPGGLLTQGSFLIATSNPTRTSPVKRGLFVLDNLLGVPPPPAPPVVPDLEDARRDTGKTPSMREAMAEHRANPKCHACHARMDPIGLALENYNAIGQWRAKDFDNDIDTSGVLVTGEKFQGVTELRTIIAGPRRKDFHRCLTEKLLTYALGRGIEPADAPTVRRIIARSEKAGGGLRDFVAEIIQSVPFQHQRGQSTE